MNVIHATDPSSAIAIAASVHDLAPVTYEKVYLIFDLGAGYLDVGLISVEDSFYEVKSKTGRIALGGEDFENAIMDFCISSFKVSTGIDITKNKKACVRLKRECATALRSLSVSKSAEVFVESISEGEDLEVDITREVFEELCDEKFKTCVQAIDRALL